ncbi:hypothetical protein SAZ10_27090 [Mesorhizobium sp. BAC0120]|uniref:hypothetical protein n=1 Tax=Mesorhizobium sp. BAC0120 TaxID=3090670 RepID=UPI00298C929E|nr:hypothetical protein [Mesorhizobium sp. BAC0120]MDW6025433.1 hypothetical protein [Mesorhizobium sp. BAC0120]
MKRIAIVVPLLFAAADASAISRYEITNMSCAKVQGLIQSQGAAILRYKSARVPGLPLYDRYVRDSGYCDPSQFATWATVPTADTNSCPVAKCIERDFLEFDRRR